MNNIDKLKMHSPNLTDKNIAKIAEIFPNCTTEVLDENGKPKIAIDFDLLQQELSGSLVGGGVERYQLNWPGKHEALLTANAPIAKTLRPVRDESVHFDTTENLFIEGDNLDALKLLQETYLGKVKMIYIDPPYNTGKDFVYADDFAENTEDYLRRSNQKDEDGNRMEVNSESNGRFHSDWLSMMYPRLKLARNLLTDDGVIFISIDDNEQANLKRLCDEVFGEKNFVAELPWKGRGGGADDKNLLQNHEYILMYTKSKEQFTVGRKIKEGEKFPKFDEEKKRFYKTQLARKWGSNSTREARPNLYYPITTYDGIEITPQLPDGSDGCWRWSKARMDVAIKNKDVEFKQREDGVWEAYEKIYKPEEGEFRTQLYSAWLQDELEEEFKNILEKDSPKNTAYGTKELKTLFDGSAYFDYPKPTNLIKILIKIASADGLILDFFAGSGTTAHAVMQLNAEDGGNRRFICVQLPEKTDEKSEASKAGFATIAEITKERIRRAADKICSDFADKLPENWDGGFRVLKTDTSNMADVYYTPEETLKKMQQSQQDWLNQVSDNIKPDRTPEDLLFQVMLDWGVDLALPIEVKQIMGRTVFFVDGNTLIACFDKQAVDNDFITALTQYQPLRVVFRDDSFKDDAAKINTSQIFQQYSESTEVKTI